jgi:hypothetical protein
LYWGRFVPKNQTLRKVNQEDIVIQKFQRLGWVSEIGRVRTHKGDSDNLSSHKRWSTCLAKTGP